MTGGSGCERPGLALEHALGEGDRGVAAVGVLLEHEAGGAGVPVVEQGALERLAGQGDQAAAVALGRLGEALLGGRDQGGELRAAQQAGDDARVAAFGQGGGAGAHAGGEAVGDPQPVAPRQLVPAAGGGAAARPGGTGARWG